MRLSSAEVMDMTRVAPKLWVGSVPTYAVRGFDVVVLCAGEHQQVQPAAPTVLRVPLHDAKLTRPEFASAIRAAKLISQARLQGKRVLVTCAMGINRSPFVAALSMLMVDKMSVADVVRQIRETRGDVTRLMPLFNKSFIAALRHYEQVR